jgi:hypothetical protein
MLDVLRGSENEDVVPETHLSAEEVASVARFLDLAPNPENVLALSWALARGEFGYVVVLRA